MSNPSASNLVTSRVAHTPNPGTSPAKPQATETEVTLPQRPQSNADNDSAPTAPHRTVSRREQSAALDEMDRVLAAEAQQMLEAEFQTIDAVLDGVFEERAVLVQKPDGTPALPPERPVKSAPEPPPAEPPAPVVAQPQPVASAPIAPVADDPPAPARPAAEPPRVIELPPDPAPIPPAPRINWLIVIRSILSQLLLSLLLILSAPVRMAPPRARTIINWLAITLMLWVPLIWLLVLWKR
jgi:hypothetical protein